MTVLVEGRARLLGDATARSAAVLDAMLVGPSGGQALAEILAGDVNPSARLPFTYPSFSGVSPQQYYHKPSSLCTTGRAVTPFHYVECPMAWPFGHGLSYTRFHYGNVTLSATTIDEATPLTVRFTVTNAGRRAGKEAVLLFVTDRVRRVTPEYKLLKRFEKVELAAGASAEISFMLDAAEDLSYIGVEGRRVLESGLFYVGLGPEVDCRCVRASATESGVVGWGLVLTLAGSIPPPQPTGPIPTTATPSPCASPTGTTPPATPPATPGPRLAGAGPPRSPRCPPRRRRGRPFGLRAWTRASPSAARGVKTTRRGRLSTPTAWSERLGGAAAT